MPFYYIQSNEIQENIDLIYIMHILKNVFHSCENIKS